MPALGVPRGARCAQSSRSWPWHTGRQTASHAPVALATRRSPLSVAPARHVRSGRRRCGGVPRAEGGGSGPSGPKSLDYEELKDQMGRLDLDKVTEMFGGNFGPQPNFVETRTLEQVTKELGEVMDLEQVGGVFSAKNISKDMRVPVEPEDVDETSFMGEEDEEERVLPEDDEDTLAFMEKMSQHDPLKDTTSEERNRKGKVLMDLINSGKNFEVVLEDSLGEVDEILLRMLDGRIAQAETDGESKDVVDGLKMLFQRLAGELDRQNACEELQLLDACLDIMIPEDVYEEMNLRGMEERKLEVVEILNEAFMLPGADGQNVDIMGIASMIGPQQDLDLEAVEGRRIFGSEVTRDSFIEVVTNTIKEVEGKQREEFLALKKWSDEIPGSEEFSEEQKVQLKKDVEKMSKALLTQRKVLAITKEILAMAEAIRWM